VGVVTLVLNDIVLVAAGVETDDLFMLELLVLLDDDLVDDEELLKVIVLVTALAAWLGLKLSTIIFYLFQASA
jgi:hypothetical protein